MIAQLTPGGTRTTVAGGLAALQSGSGTDVLLLPGYTGSKEDFAPLLTPLADAGLRVTAVDLPGQYESPGPEDPDAYRPAALARAVCEVARSLDAPVHLLGHSYGGLVARAAVLHEPGLFRSLVLLCSGPAALGGARRARLEQLEPVLEQHGVAGVYAAMQTVAEAEPGYRILSSDLAAFLEKRFFASSAAGLQGMGRALRSEPDLVDELRAIGVPVTVACGVDDDAWSPAEQEAMARRLGGELTLLPGSAHSPAVENPDATVAFLRAVWSQSAG